MLKGRQGWRPLFLIPLSSKVPLMYLLNVNRSRQIHSLCSSFALFKNYRLLKTKTPVLRTTPALLII